MMEQLSLNLICQESATNPKNKLKIANELIIAKYQLKLLATKLWFAILSTLKDSDTNFFKYKFKVRDLAQTAGISVKKGYVKITVDLLDEVASQRIQIFKRTDIDFEKSQFIKASMLSSIEYLGNGEIEIVIDPKLHDYFFQLKNNFTVLELQELLSFDSIYAIRIYQIIRQYGSIGKRTINIDELKAILMIEDKYKSFADIRRIIIEPAIKNINKKSNLEVSYTSNGSRGRKTTEVTFLCKQKESLLNSFSDEQLSLYNKLIKIKVNKIKAVELISQYSLTLIKENLEYTLQRKRKNMAGYFIRAVQNDYYGIYRECELMKNNVSKSEYHKLLLTQYQVAVQAGDKASIEIWQNECQKNNIDISGY